MSASLVICIGNVERGDDGVAHHVAELLEGGTAAAVLRVPQLDVTLAERVAQADVVVLVDACRRDEPPVEVADVLADTVDTRTGHGIAPGALLTLSAALYATAPRTVLVSVAAPQMEHGEGLSETAEAASREAASRVLSLLEELRELL